MPNNLKKDDEKNDKRTQHSRMVQLHNQDWLRELPTKLLRATSSLSQQQSLALFCCFLIIQQANCQLSTPMNSSLSRERPRNGSYVAIRNTLDRSKSVTSPQFNISPPKPNIGKQLLEISNLSLKDTMSDSELINSLFVTKETDFKLLQLYLAQGYPIDKLIFIPSHNGVIVSGTLLSLACHEKQSALIRYLLEQGADPNAALPPEVEPPLIEVLRNKMIDETKLLIAAKADVNSRGKQNTTPLMVAAALDLHEIVESLITVGADINLTNQENVAAVHVAAMRSLKCLKLLFNAGANMECQDIHGTLPLGYAIFHRHLAAVQYLYEIEQWQISKAAERNNLILAHTSPEILTFITEHNDIPSGYHKLNDAYPIEHKPTMLGLKLIFGESYNFVLFNDYLSKGYLIDNIFQITPKVGKPFYINLLNLAVRQKNRIVIDYLLSRGADPHISVFAISPLFLTIIQNDDETLRILAKYGAHLKDVLYKELTPLMMVANRGSAQQLKILLDEKADPNTKNKYGETALHYAVNHPRCVKELINAGILIDAIDQKGFSALGLAMSNGNLDTIRILLEHGATIVGPLSEYKILYEAAKPEIKSLMKNHYHKFYPTLSQILQRQSFEFLEHNLFWVIGTSSASILLIILVLISRQYYLNKQQQYKKITLAEEFHSKIARKIRDSKLGWESLHEGHYQLDLQQVVAYESIKIKEWLEATVTMATCELNNDHIKLNIPMPQDIANSIDKIDTVAVHDATLTFCNNLENSFKRFETLLEKNSPTEFLNKVDALIQEITAELFSVKTIIASYSNAQSNNIALQKLDHKIQAQQQAKNFKQHSKALQSSYNAMKASYCALESIKSDALSSDLAVYLQTLQPLRQMLKEPGIIDKLQNVHKNLSSLKLRSHRVYDDAVTHKRSISDKEGEIEFILSSLEKNKVASSNNFSSKAVAPAPPLNPAVTEAPNIGTEAEITPPSISTAPARKASAAVTPDTRHLHQEPSIIFQPTPKPTETRQIKSNPPSAMPMASVKMITIDPEKQKPLKQWINSADYYANNLITVLADIEGYKVDNNILKYAMLYHMFGLIEALSEFAYHSESRSNLDNILSYRHLLVHCAIMDLNQDNAAMDIYEAAAAMCKLLTDLSIAKTPTDLRVSMAKLIYAIDPTEIGLYNKLLDLLTPSARFKKTIKEPTDVLAHLKNAFQELKKLSSKFKDGMKSLENYHNERDAMKMLIVIIAESWVRLKSTKQSDLIEVTKTTKLFLDLCIHLRNQICHQKLVTGDGICRDISTDQLIKLSIPDELKFSNIKNGKEAHNAHLLTELLKLASDDFVRQKISNDICNFIIHPDSANISWCVEIKKYHISKKQFDEVIDSARELLDKNNIEHSNQSEILSGLKMLDPNKYELAMKLKIDLVLITKKLGDYCLSQEGYTHYINYLATINALGSVEYLIQQSNPVINIKL